MNATNVGGPNIPATELYDERFKTLKMMIVANRDSRKGANFKETCLGNEKLPHVIVTCYIAFIMLESYGETPKISPHRFSTLGLRSK